MRGRIRNCILLLTSLLLCGCQRAAVSETVVLAAATPSPSPVTVHIAMLTTPVPSAIPMPRELLEPADTIAPTIAPTETPEPTEAPTDTPEATQKAVSTPKATAKPKATPKPTKAPTPVPTATLEPIATPVPTATPTLMPTVVPTVTPEPTPAPTQVPQPVQVPPGGRYSGEEVLLAARVAYFESHKSSEEGLRAVVCVIANRIESSRWPDTLYDVVYQANQFTVVKGSSFATATIPDHVIAYANDELNNKDSGSRLLPTNVMSFRAASSGESWGDRVYVGTYGGNAFFSS